MRAKQLVSACMLYLDDIELTERKAYVPDFLRAIFQDSDRFDAHDDEYDRGIVQYRASRNSILTRLDLIGCTENLCRQRFQRWRDETILNEKETLEEFEECADDPDDTTLRALQELSWEEWQRRVPDVLRTQYDLENYDKFVDETDRCMKDDDPSYSWLWFDGTSSLISLRAIVEAYTDIKTIILDISDLIEAEWISTDENICANKISVVSTRGQPVGPTILLAEGKSDTAILKSSIRRFHPDIVDFITFLDHADFGVEGGAAFVVKILKAFAAARIPANLVAIFDNDAAGQSAYQQAKNLDTPQNMTCIHLPDIDLARSYPTIGPQGEHKTDINGKACSIELYLGREALSSEGKLRPVYWKGYNEQSKCYQGEVYDKKAVQDVFQRAMSDYTDDLDDLYPEMQLLWRTIIEAAARTAEASQRIGRPPPRW